MQVFLKLERVIHHWLVLQGGALLISKSYLTDVAGIMAVEAYHAGAIRSLLFENSSQVIQPYNVTIDAAAAVSMAVLLPVVQFLVSIMNSCDFLSVNASPCSLRKQVSMAGALMQSSHSVQTCLQA